jgi:hypothetical protein
MADFAAGDVLNEPMESPPMFGDPSIILEKWDRYLKALEASPRNPEVDREINAAQWAIQSKHEISRL